MPCTEIGMNLIISTIAATGSKTLKGIFMPNELEIIKIDKTQIMKAKILNKRIRKFSIKLAFKPKKTLSIISKFLELM